jgi:hypothetical protein
MGKNEKPNTCPMMDARALADIDLPWTMKDRGVEC